MTSYRPQKDGSPYKLLLPLSLGTSSSSLLHILDRLQQRQLNAPLGRVGYDLHILIIDPSTIYSGYRDVEGNFNAAKEYYTRHKYTVVPLHSIFQYDATIKDALRDFGFVNEGFDSDKERLDAFRASLSTATAKDDIDNHLLVRLIVAFAKDNDCEGVVWGDSDSRLAAKTLANVAKGRGASLTWQVCDGVSPWELDFCFPLRELYKSELELYVNQIPELSSIIIPDLRAQEIASNRNMSIDGLMDQYIRTQGEKYRGIMANVVRTVNKLQPMINADNSARCSLCAAPLQRADSSGESDESTFSMCYACLRSRADAIQNQSSSHRN